MKKFFLLNLILLLMSWSLTAQTTLPAGSGTVEDPYQIATLDDLYWLSTNSSVWNMNFVQTADIDASTTSTWNSGAGFSPIGNSTTKFTGVYNGDGYKISGLTIYRPSVMMQGLFGYTNTPADIQKIGLENVNIVGKDLTGSLVGMAYASNISECYATGRVTGDQFTGGLIGQMGESNLSKSHSECQVSAYNSIGGLVGNNSFSSISESYATGTIAGNIGQSISKAGGLIGANSYANITNSYTTAQVSGYEYVGGLIGENQSSTNIVNCYSTGRVTGTSSTGGLIGSNSGTVSSSYWDTETSNQTESAGGDGKTTAEMMDQSTYIDWDFTDIWGMIEGISYPYLLSLSECTDGTIALTSDNNEQTVGVETEITPIVYTIGGGADGAKAEGLPNGVTGTYENGTFTISGTPTVFGWFNFEVTTTGSEPCNEATDGGVITVDPPANYCHGSAYAVPSEYNIGDSPVGAEYALGQPDTKVAILDNTNEFFELDLTGGGVMRPSGTIITIKAGASCNLSDDPAIIRIQRSDGSGFHETGVITLSDCKLGDYTVVLNGDTRYINITKINDWSRAAVIDAVTYECAPSCAPNLSIGTNWEVCSGDNMVYMLFSDASNILCSSETESPTEVSIDWVSEDVLDWSGNFSDIGDCNSSDGGFYIQMLPKEGGSIPAGIYSCKVTFTNGEDCTSLDYFINVTVLALPEAPTAEVTGGSIEICGEGFVTLEVNGPSDATYRWYKDNEFQFGGQSHTFDFFAPDNEPGIYTYEVTRQLQEEVCESAKTSVSIIVREVPSTTIIADKSEIQEEESVVLTASGAESYSWSSLPEGFISTNSVVTVSPSVNTTYIVTGTTDGCSSSDEIIIYVRETCENSEDQYEPNNSMDENLFSIPVDLIIGANILNAKDPDWYRLEISETAQYSLKLTSSETVYPSVDLYSSNGRRLKSVSRTQPDSYNLPSGIYYIKVSARVKTYLCYTLQVVNDGAAVGALATYDDTKSAEITLSEVEQPEFKVYPNPFSQRLNFEFVSPVDTYVQIDIYDLMGRRIKTIFNDQVEAEIKYTTDFVPENTVSSMYVYRMIMGESVINGKVTYKQ